MVSYLKSILDTIKLNKYKVSKSKGTGSMQEM